MSRTRFLWLRQTFGFRTDTSSPAVAKVDDGPADVEAAVRTLMRAWSPSTLLPGGPADYEGEYDNGCSCGGEDDDGNDLGCNCGAGCSCTSCEAFAWQLHKRCSARTGSTRCGKETRYRVIAYRLVPTVLSDSSEDAVCPHSAAEQCHCRPGCVFLDAGELPSVHQHLSACSVAHAQQIVVRMQEVYAEPDDKPTRLRYRIEAWTYEPHWTELPEHLASLLTLTGDAKAYVGVTIRNLSNSRDTDYWLKAVRETLARAVWRAAQPLPEDPADEDPYDESYGPLQEEPSEPWGADA